MQGLVNTALFGLRGTRAPRSIAHWEGWANANPQLADVFRLPIADKTTIAGRPSLVAGSAGDDLSPQTGPAITLTEPDRAVLSVQGAWVGGRGGEVLTDDGCALVDDRIDGPLSISDLELDDERSRRAHNAAKRSKIIGRGPLPRGRSIDGALGILACHSGHNYFHWLIDALPRIEWIEAAGTQPDAWCVHRSDFHRQSLELLGIKPQDCVFTSRYRLYRPRRVLRPAGPLALPTPSSCAFLSERLLPAALRAASTAKSLPRRIYISRTRRRTHWRRVTNEEEVMGFLRTKGFQKVHLEDYSFCDQVRMFHEAEYVVAPHGAGLTNIAFCQPGTRILELNTPCRPIDCFYRIAALRALRYLDLVGIQDGASAHFGQDSNLRIEINHLDAAMTELDRHSEATISRN